MDLLLKKRSFRVFMPFWYFLFFSRVIPLEMASVNEALKKRVEETKALKVRLEEQHSRTVQDIKKYAERPPTQPFRLFCGCCFLDFWKTKKVFSIFVIVWIYGGFSGERFGRIVVDGFDYIFGC